MGYRQFCVIGFVAYLQLAGLPGTSPTALLAFSFRHLFRASLAVFVQEYNIY